MSNKNEVIQQIIGLLGSLIEDDTEPQKTEQEKPKTRRKRTSTAKKQSTNKFETMDVRHMHKKDVEIDKLLNQQPPCPRTRQYSTIDVECRSCGKRESVNPVLVTEASRYKCNNCSISRG
jgi:lysyl-tRNA synthetase class I